MSGWKIDTILAEFVNPNTYLRVVVATISFDMGWMHQIYHMQFTGVPYTT